MPCGAARTDCGMRFAKGRAIAWSVRALNRFERANILKAPTISYGGRHARAVRA